MNQLVLFNPAMMRQKLTVDEIIKCNDVTCYYGLDLTAKEARQLVEAQTETLLRHGRVEFTGGIIQKLILTFCNSPFLFKDNYAENLFDLLETFYYFKNEMLDEIGDDELLSLMKDYFDHNCQGSIELLQNRELETLARSIRFGMYCSGEAEEEYDAGEDYDE